MSTAILYRTNPQYVHKAADAIRRDRVKAYPFRDSSRQRNPITGKYPATAPSWFATDKPISEGFRHAWERQGRRVQFMGVVRKSELASLYVKRQRRKAEMACPFAIGQAVMIGEVPATVQEIRGRICIVATVLLGKQHTQAIPYAHLRPG